MKSLITKAAVALLSVSSVYADNCTFRVDLNNTLNQPSALLSQLDNDTEAFDWVSVFAQQYMDATACHENDSSKKMSDCWNEAYVNPKKMAKDSSVYNKASHFASQHSPQININDAIIAYDSTGKAKYTSGNTTSNIEVFYRGPSSTSDVKKMGEAITHIITALDIVKNECSELSQPNQTMKDQSSYVIQILKTCGGHITRYNFTDGMCK